jgi:hypothetical protein
LRRFSAIGLASAAQVGDVHAKSHIGKQHRKEVSRRGGTGYAWDEHQVGLPGLAVAQ